MTSLPANCIPVNNTSLPVAIDYPAALALRQMALVQDELPKCLLAPEVNALLHYMPDLYRKMLLAALWNTGERLALTQGGFLSGTALSVRVAGPPETADGKSGKNIRESTSQQSDPYARCSVRQPAADDGGDTENSAGAA